MIGLSGGPSYTYIRKVEVVRSLWQSGDSDWAKEGLSLVGEFPYSLGSEGLFVVLGIRYLVNEKKTGRVW